MTIVLEKRETRQCDMFLKRETINSHNVHAHIVNLLNLPSVKIPLDGVNNTLTPHSARRETKSNFAHLL